MTLPLSHVKSHLSELADTVAATHERLHITRNGRDHVVLIGTRDLESVEATLELLADSEAQDRLAQSEQDIAEGDVLDEAQIREFIAARHVQ